MADFLTRFVLTREKFYDTIRTLVLINRRGCNITQYNKPGIWQPGRSGNPKGRPPKNRVLTRILEEVTDETMVIGGEELTAKEAVARLVTQFMLRGEVMLGGRLIQGSVSDWLAMIRWFYTHVDGAAPKGIELDEQPEMVVRVVHEEKPIPDFSTTREGNEESSETWPSSEGEEILMLGSGEEDQERME